MIEFLFLNGAKVDSVDGRLNTALHIAADHGHTMYFSLKFINWIIISIVYNILKRNADKALKNNEGKTPLELAVEKCHADIVTLLVNMLHMILIYF